MAFSTSKLSALITRVPSAIVKSVWLTCAFAVVSPPVIFIEPLPSTTPFKTLLPLSSIAPSLFINNFLSETVTSFKLKRPFSPTLAKVATVGLVTLNFLRFTTALAPISKP